MLSEKHLHEYEFYLSLSHLPRGWTVTSLNDVATKITDGTHKTPKYQESGVRFISIKNIKPFRAIDWTAYEKYITREEHSELIRRCKPEMDDILFPRIGTLGYAKRIDFKEEVSIFVGLGLVKPNKEAVLPKYLEFYMNTSYIAQLSRRKANGSGRLTLPLAQTKKFPIPVAPIDEQKRIVEKIETLFAELDKSEEALREVQKLLTRYRQSVLKAAVTGELTADWRAENAGRLEHGRDLLARILKTRREQWQGRGQYKEPVAPDTSDLPELPKGWVWSSVDQLTSIVTKGSSPNWQGFQYVSKGVLFIRSQNIGWGNLRLEDKVFLPDSFNGKEQKSIIRKGDVLLNIVGASIGRAAIATFELEGANCNQAVAILRAVEHFLAVWVVRYLLSPVAQQVIHSEKVDVARANYSLAQVRSLRVPFPSREEQHEIGRRLGLIDIQLENMQRNCEAELTRSAALRQSILKDAFSGRLVPQDPADEPAAELLARIKVERENVPSKRSVKKKAAPRRALARAPAGKKRKAAQ